LKNPSAFHDRSDVIDAFRAFAIISVVLFHYLLRWKDLYGYDHATSPLWDVGSYGVHVFLVISGLVISMTVRRSASALEFGVKRFARLYPAYFVCMTAVFLSMLAFGPEPFKRSLADYLMNIPLLAKDTGFRLIDGLYWSLVVEVKFYLFVALFYALLRERFWIGIVAMGLLGMAGIGRGIFIGEYLSFFLIGMSLYFLLYAKEFPAAAITGLTGIFLYAFYSHYIPMAEAHIYILGTTAAMAALIAFCPHLRLGPLAYLGRISYALYLVHQYIGVTIIRTLKEKTGMPDLAALGMATGLCLLLAVLVHHYVEKPCQKIILEGWKNRGQETGFNRYLALILKR
jgi:peptidoglycan/LPS O-acetylase OafA/YrhL